MAVQIGVYAHPTNSYATKPVHEGFSWTTFWFGLWPAALRGDVRGALTAMAIPIGNIIGVVIAVLIFDQVLWRLGTYPPVWFSVGVLVLWPLAYLGGLALYASKYNAWHARRLREAGWFPVATPNPPSAFRATAPSLAEQASPHGAYAIVDSGAGLTPPSPPEPARDSFTVERPAAVDPMLAVDTASSPVPWPEFGLIGRDPSAGRGDPEVAVMIVVDDPDRVVSKTHAAVGRDQDGLWVMDRRSTNGTSLIGRDGGERHLAPGARTPVQAGEVIVLGGERRVQPMAARLRSRPDVA